MKQLLTALVILSSLFSQAQIYDPVKWSTSVHQISDTEYELISKASIEQGWHLYSQTVPAGGPIPTTFLYDESIDRIEMVGVTAEPEGHTINDPVFEMEITYFENTATFKQRVKVEEEVSKIEGTVSFMACNDTNCTPPNERDLVFELVEEIGVTNNQADEVVAVEKNTSDISTQTDTKSSQSHQNSKGLWTIFFIAFISGFAALLTPCVFPMIPMTVSFFTKQSKDKATGIKNAIIYGLSIIIIYVLLGTIVSAVFGADALNALSTNVWFNLIFFVLLLVFAASFLGAFEIMLPNSWANKVDKQADRGGLIGIFFMALALAIVSFSCTGPIVGTLLVEAATGGTQIGPL